MPDGPDPRPTADPARIRVLFLDSAATAPLGAGPWLHVQLLRDLDRSKHELFVACAPPGGPEAPAPMHALVEEVSDVEVVDVDLGPNDLRTSLRGTWRQKLWVAGSVLRALGGFVRLARFVRRHRIQVIHTDERPRDALAAAIVAKLTGARFVVHMHVDHNDDDSKMLKWSLGRADGIIAISEFVKRSLMDHGLPADRIFVVLNGIDPGRWDPSDDGHAIRDELGMDADTPMVLTVCRVILGKGVDDLIKAMPAVRREFPTARLVSVGFEQFPGVLDLFNDMARDLGVADAITFAGWRNDIPMFLAACDVFGLPSRGEPFGLAYLEAMAMEKPVVAFRSGATAEVVVDGETGFVEPEGDVDGLADHIVELLRRPELRRAMGTAGRARVESEFTLQRMAAGAADVYRRVVDR